MTNYDFLNLSPFEFELLTRDLLQKAFSIQLESFGPGRDTGIDLRFAKGEHLIVQCKRYKTYDSLVQNLKGEAVSVRKLNPPRYILATNVSLLPQQKDTILEIFQPFIKDPGDIFGKEDLNNLIQQHKSIELDHFKLWMSSTNVLNAVIHSASVNKSRFAFDRIQKKLQVYVQNDSFLEAQKILEANNYVIISGIPGIGKTTLAEMLVYSKMAEGFDFVYLSDTISEGYEMYVEGCKQIFLFDDFLGSNFLENRMKTNEEKSIIQFIKRIKGDKDKLLIFTTREYILNQATIKSEDFDNIVFAKCILDLSKYSTRIRAHIVYNHLFFAEIPYEFIDELIRTDSLMALIEHPNYSPRIIEYLAESEYWKRQDIESFPSALLSLFDEPEKIWGHAFNSQISSRARVILFAMVICGKDVPVEILWGQVKCLDSAQLFSKSNLDGFTEFKRALKELDNSFIKVSKSRIGSSIISFHNPSIQDFVVSCINQSESIKIELINTFQYLKPALSIFGNNPRYESDRRIILSEAMLEKLEMTLANDFEKLFYSPLNQVNAHFSTDDYIVLKLEVIDGYILSGNRSRLESFVFERFKSLIYSENITRQSVHEYCNLLVRYSSIFEAEVLDIETILLNIIPSLQDEEDFGILAEFENSFNEEFSDFKEKYWDQYQEIFSGVIDELSYVSSFDKRNTIGNLEKNLDTLKELAKYYDAEVGHAVRKIENAIEEIKQREEDEHWEMYDYSEGRSDGLPRIYVGTVASNPGLKMAIHMMSKDEKGDIEALFRSLK